MRGTKGPFLIRLFGWSEGQFLIAELPSGNAEWRSGDKAIVRFILEGRALGFRTRVLSGQSKPDPIIFLEYPERIEVQSLRRHPRAPVTGVGQIMSMRTTKTVEIHLDDLSASGGGGFIDDASYDIAKDDKVKAELNVIGMDPPLTGLVAHVRIVKEIDHSTGKRRFVGLEFEWTEESRGHQGRIVSFVDARLEALGQKPDG